MPRLDDAARLAALDASGILFRRGEDRLVSLCLAAVETLSAAVSHINIITADTQIHVASYPPSQDGDIPASEAGCPRVVLYEDVVAISDARNDAEACNQPWVTEAGMQSYLGIPLRFQGQVLGSFCVVDTKVRPWHLLDIVTLEELARRAEETILTFS